MIHVLARVACERRKTGIQIMLLASERTKGSSAGRGWGRMKKEERRISCCTVASSRVTLRSNRVEEWGKEKEKKRKKIKLVCRECSNCACMRVYVYTCVRVNVRVYVSVCALAYDVIAIGRATINSKRSRTLTTSISIAMIAVRRGGTRSVGASRQPRRASRGRSSI